MAMLWSLRNDASGIFLRLALTNDILINRTASVVLFILYEQFYMARQYENEDIATCTFWKAKDRKNIIAAESKNILTSNFFDWFQNELKNITCCNKNTITEYVTLPRAVREISSQHNLKPSPNKNQLHSNSQRQLMSKNRFNN